MDDFKLNWNVSRLDRGNSIDLSKIMNENMMNYENIMNESIYKKVNSHISMFFTQIHNMEKNGYSDEYGIDRHSGKDPYLFTIEFDELKKEYPDTYPKYITKFYNTYKSLFGMFEALDLPKNNENEYEHPYINSLSNCLQHIIEHLQEMLKPENEVRKKLTKEERLIPIEKILIVYYLNQSKKLFNNPIGQFNSKPGKYFLSKLFDINPDSIKNPAKKVSEYTTDIIETQQKALNLYPTLEKVKLFFDNSDLNDISKIIELRIKELRIKAGKD